MPIGMGDIEPVQGQINGIKHKKFPGIEEQDEINTDEINTNEKEMSSMDKEIDELLDEYQEDLDNILYIKNILEKEPSPNIKVLFYLYNNISRINKLMDELSKGVDSYDTLLNLKISLNNLFTQIQVILQLTLKKNKYQNKIDVEYAPKTIPVKPLKKDWLDYGSSQFYY